MQLFTYNPTRYFTPGVLADAYVPLTLLPLNNVRGAGARVYQQMRTFAGQLSQAPGVPEAWNGFISGQFVVQSLVDPNSGGPGG